MGKPVVWLLRRMPMVWLWSWRVPMFWLWWRKVPLVWLVSSFLA